MAELQATIEISVELNKFHNVDLFQRGQVYYQIQTVLKTPPKISAKVEISDNKLNVTKGGQENSSAFVQGNIGKSQKFQILYRNEEVEVADLFIYRIHLLVESAKLEKNLESLDLRLEVQLWCNDEDEPSESEGKMELASTRSLQLHISPTKGLHHSRPVLFDYFHLSAVEVVIHGTIIAIHQPYLNMPKYVKGAKTLDHATLEAVYFGQKLSTPPPSNVNSSSTRLQHAHLMHKTICNILLSSHESLQENLQLFASKIPGNKFQLAKKDCHTRLGEAVMKIQGALEEDDFIQTAITDITQLCAENVILWAQFLEIVLRQPQIHFCLARDHHNTRIRRFAEGFFTLDHKKASCLSCYDPGLHGHSALATIVRNSQYFNNLPTLPLECSDLDGDENSLPILFEDIYHDSRAFPLKIYQKAAHTTPTEDSHTEISRQRSSSNSSSSVTSDVGGSSPHMRKRSSKKKFIKNIKPEGFKRPSSYYCPETEVLPIKTDTEVTLIGYRKITHQDFIPSTAVHLGTLSPDSPEGQGNASLGTQLEKTYSSSLSSIFPTSCMNRGSNDSIPNLCDTQADGPPPSSPPRPSVDFVTVSEGPCIPLPQPSSIQKDKFSVIISKPPICPPQADCTKSGSGLHKYAEKHSKDLSNTSSPQKEFNEAEITIQCKNDNPSCMSTSEISQEKLYKPAEETSLNLGKEDFTSNNLANILSANDEDFSDEDTNVANGFDGDLESYRDGFSIMQASDSLASSLSLTPKTSVTSDVITSLQKAPSQKSLDATITFDSKNDSALGSEISSQEEVNYSCSPTGVTRSGQINTLATGGSPTCSYADPRQKVTVIELLKEEYSRSQTILNCTDSKSLSTLVGNKDTTCKESNLSGQRAASDSDILRNCEEETARHSQKDSQDILMRTNVERTEKRKTLLSTSSSYPELSHASKPETPRLVSVVGVNTINFIQLRERLKIEMNFPGYFYSECPTLASRIPYFRVPTEVDETSGIHLIVCVHGLDGNSADLRLVRTYLEMALPGFRVEFLMSERNQQDTFADFDKMTERLVEEIMTFMDAFGFDITRISFVGHSLGNIIIRSTLSHPKMSHLLPKLYTFLSLSGPHLGTLYNTSGLVNMGMWFMQKWKKSGSLLQLSLKDHPDPRQTFLYRLSQKQVLQNFKHVLLVGSHQDRYVPYHSSRIEICKAAQKDSSTTGAVYREMVQNILEPIIQSPHCTLIRYDVFHALPSTANTMIGRAAHIAVLDSEIFIEKFLTVTGLKYFQ